VSEQTELLSAAERDTQTGITALALSVCNKHQLVTVAITTAQLASKAGQSVRCRRCDVVVWYACGNRKH